MRANIGEQTYESTHMRAHRRAQQEHTYESTHMKAHILEHIGEHTYEPAQPKGAWTCQKSHAGPQLRVAGEHLD